VVLYKKYLPTTFTVLTIKLYFMAKQIFKVQLDGVDITAAQAAGLQKAINTAATTYIAKNFKALPKDSIWGIKNPEWLGIWIKNFKNLDALKKLGGFKRF
jgi:hypothetical protein